MAVLPIGITMNRMCFFIISLLISFAKSKALEFFFFARSKALELFFENGMN